MGKKQTTVAKLWRLLGPTNWSTDILKEAFRSEKSGAHASLLPGTVELIAAGVLHIIFIMRFIINNIRIRYILRERGEISSRSKIERPPAHGLLSILELIYTKKTFEHIFKQTIDDLRDEHYQYLQQNKKWHALAARLRIYPIIIGTGISLLGAKIIKKFIEILKVI